MSAKIYMFPMKGTPLNKWFNTALEVKKQKNFVAAKLWIMGNVPQPFRTLLMRELEGNQ